MNGALAGQMLDNGVAHSTHMKLVAVLQDMPRFEGKVLRGTRSQAYDGHSLWRWL